MATTKDVKRLPSGRLQYRGETFSGYNQPKRTPGKNKKSAVLAKKGNEVKIVRFGDPDMTINKTNRVGAKTFAPVTVVTRRRPKINLLQDIGVVTHGDD